jgi:hypothetical protein
MVCDRVQKEFAATIQFVAIAKNHRVGVRPGLRRLLLAIAISPHPAAMRGVLLSTEPVNLVRVALLKNNPHRSIHKDPNDAGGGLADYCFGASGSGCGRPV